MCQCDYRKESNSESNQTKINLRGRSDHTQERLGGATTATIKRRLPSELVRCQANGCDDMLRMKRFLHSGAVAEQSGRESGVP